MTGHAWLAAALVVLLAAPAAAQSSTTHTGGCQPFQNTQLRCALHIPSTGHRLFLVDFISRGDGRTGGQVQAWHSQCGLPGQPGPVMGVANSFGTHRVMQLPTSLISNNCFEVFVFNCREGGRAVPCERGFATATIRIEQQPR